MSTAQESAAPARSCLPRFGCLLLLALPVFFFLMMAGIGIGLLDLGVTLLFGWISFIRDVWPKISWNWGSISTGILCLALIFFLGHSFLDWLSRGIASAENKSFRWPLKWTACGLGAIGLCFLVGMAVVGAAHQIGWIAQSEESLYERRPKNFEHYMEIQAANSVIAGALKSTNTVRDVRSQIRKNIQEIWGGSSHPPNLQSLHLLMLVNSNSQVDGIVIFPRNKESRQRWGGEYHSLAEGNNHIRPDELTIFIEANESRLVAF